MTSSDLPFDPWHLVHLAWAGVVGIATWVAKDHFKRDDARFEETQKANLRIASRLESISDQMAKNHSDLLKLMLKEQK